MRGGVSTQIWPTPISNQPELNWINEQYDSLLQQSIVAQFAQCKVQRLNLQEHEAKVVAIALHNQVNSLLSELAKLRTGT